MTAEKAISGIILALLLTSMLTSAFNIQPVDAGTIIISDDYSTIQEAINAASPGDTIFVEAGTYYENLVVNKTLSLVGEDAKNTIIEGGAGTGVLIVVDHVNVTGFTMRNSGSWPNGGIRLNSTSHCNITGNKITNNWYGIYLDSSSNNIISENNITDNTYGVALYPSANNLYSSSSNSVSGNNITNNGFGIVLDYSSNNSVSGNNITNCVVSGVDFGSSSNNTVSNNIFVDSGFSVWDSYGNVVVDNLVNGKPLVYLEGASDVVVDDAGQVILVDCSRMRVENLDLSRTSIGVELWRTNSTTITGNNITANWEFGVVLYSSSDNTVSGNNITNNGQGVHLFSSFDNTVSGNNITNNGKGVYFFSSFDNTVSGNNITNNNYGVWLHFSSNNNSVSGNALTNNYYGIYLGSSSNNTVSNNIFVDSGFSVWDSYGNVVVDNLVNGKPLVYLEGVSDVVVDDGGQVILVDCSRMRVENLDLSHASIGVELWRTNSTTITGNNITNNVDGILLHYSSNNSVSGNNITNNAFAIMLDSSSNNTVSGNNITDSWDGIYLDSSSNNSISDNSIKNNTDAGIWLDSSSNNSIFDNRMTANGRYGIYVGDSHQNAIARNDVSNHNYSGIEVSSSSDNTISENNVTDNWYGIELDDSSHNSLNRNLILTSINVGINFLSHCSDNSVAENNVTNNGRGIYLGASYNNTITRNNIANSIYDGIQIYLSSNNRIFYNSFKNNTRQVHFFTLGDVNAWDDGYPSGGNCWSDYNGTDLHSGPYQNKTGSDGIGDTPYVIDAESEDHYPLMKPFHVGDLNSDGIIDLRDVAIAALSLGSYPNHARWNPRADINKDNKVNAKDFVLIVKNLGSMTD